VAGGAVLERDAVDDQTADAHEFTGAASANAGLLLAVQSDAITEIERRLRAAVSFAKVTVHGVGSAPTIERERPSEWGQMQSRGERKSRREESGVS
jgi:hypothetical protein